MKVNELNILLADDDPDDCQFFKQAITEFIPLNNFSAVHDGEQLMQALINDTARLPDVIFLDLNMPRKNGLECLKEIKQDKRLQDIGIVILSTSCEPEHIDMLFKTGADVYICKPASFEQLVQLIQHALPIAAENLITTEKVKYVLNA